MTWFKVDDKFAFHAKAIKAGNEACGAWVRMGAYCSDHGLDGVISADMALLIAGKQSVLDRLVGAVVKPGGTGLLEAVDAGYQLHDFAHYNPSAADVAAERIRLAGQRSAAGKASAAKRAVQRAVNDSLNDTPNEPSSPSRPVPSRPVTGRQKPPPRVPDDDEIASLLRDSTLLIDADPCVLASAWRDIARRRGRDDDELFAAADHALDALGRAYNGAKGVGDVGAFLTGTVTNLLAPGGLEAEDAKREPRAKSTGQRSGPVHPTEIDPDHERAERLRLIGGTR